MDVTFQHENPFIIHLAPYEHIDALCQYTFHNNPNIVLLELDVLKVTHTTSANAHKHTHTHAARFSEVSVIRP